MEKLTKEQFKKLIALYKEARAKIALEMADYDGVKVREVALLATVDKQIKILEKETVKYLETSIPREYKAEIKRAEEAIKEVGVKGLGVTNLTTIDKKALEYQVQDMSERLLMSVRQVRKSVIDNINQVKQQKIRDLLAVDTIRGKSAVNTAKEAASIMRKEGITGFINKRGARLKLDTYMYQLVRNNIQMVHNHAAYNRYVEAGIEIVKYSYIGDAKVSTICRPREGKYFYLKGIVPPPMGSHFGCRHNLRPVVIVPEGVKVHLHYPNP